MADEPAGEVKTLDAEHPHVKALTDAGISHDRLTQLVNSSSKPITHPAVSSLTPTQEGELQTNLTDAQNQAIANMMMLPQLNTSGVTDANQLGQQFQQAMQQLITPPIPANPQLPEATPAAPQSNGPFNG